VKRHEQERYPFPTTMRRFRDILGDARPYGWTRTRWFPLPWESGVKQRRGHNETREYASADREADPPLHALTIDGREIVWKLPRPSEQALPGLSA